MSKRETAISIAWHYLGRPYIWGGDNPAGFDCSGLVIECMKAVGVLPRRGDWSAEGLYQLWRYNQIGPEPQPGDMVFWADESGRHIHVEMAIGDGLSIGASGGGSWATDPVEALRRGAFIKVRPYATRGGIFHFANPGY